MGLKEELDGYFDASFGTRVQEAIIKCFFQAYADAIEACKKFPKEEAHDLLGFQRWVELRAQIRGLGGRFREIETYSEPNGPAPSYHIVINSEKIILTVSSVISPGIMPRPASYRMEYAIQNQYELFKPLQQNPKVYALLIHGTNQKDRSKPAFIQVRFPDKNFVSYVHKIDLFSRFDALVKNLSGLSEEKHPFPIPAIVTKEGQK